jgi:hypothetical protein
MPRARKNKPRQAKPESHLNPWWIILGFVAGFALLALAANSPDHIQLLIGCYALFPFSIFITWFVLRSGVLYLRGTAIYRVSQPAQFWVALILVIIPPLLISGSLIAIHLWSLVAA